MDIITAIKDRRSVRAFLPKPVPQNTVLEILEAAKFAPSGVNTQPWHVIIVTGNYIQKIGDEIVKAREKNVTENPDYHYYPTEWVDPYKSRRKACGLALYSAVNITLEETEARKAQWYRNYYFFGAPVGLLFFVDAKLKKGSWVDMGLFIENVMLAARSFGLETCPQASLAEYPDIVRKITEVPKTKSLICGMAMGFADWQHPINQYRTTRESVATFTKFLGF